MRQRAEKRKLRAEPKFRKCRVCGESGLVGENMKCVGLRHYKHHECIEIEQKELAR